MAIPRQDQFILPFLQTLSDGKEHTRSQIKSQLVRYFGITPVEEKHMSGVTTTVINRIAWCDVYFVKAGFVAKCRHPSDNMQDVFQITPVGLQELNKHPYQITIAYLQTFYRV